MGQRLESIGIKQAIRLEWMQKTTSLLLAGMDSKTIRRELHDFLTTRKGSGTEGIRSENTRVFAVNNLMKIWVSPDPELIPFRNALLAFLRENPSMALAVHWGMISAVYPFWFNVARQTGRLLALQDQVTQTQIINRLKEQYGDRQTISRYGRYVLRSFVAWGVIKDAKTLGCYEKLNPIRIDDINLATLMFESALYTNEDRKISADNLHSNPAFFVFKLPVISGNYISQINSRILVNRYGMDEEYLRVLA